MQFPNFDPVLIHLGPFAIRWYALAYIAGILLGWRYCVGLIRKAELWTPRRPAATPAQIDDLILWLTLGIIVGGRLGYVLFYGRGEYAAHPLEIFEVWNGGMSFHGGFLGVCIAVVAFALVNRIDILRLADLVAPCAPIGLFFGRVANFINGELWGRVTHVPWGMVFCSPHIIAANGGDCPAGLEPRHPSQLYEATLEGLVLFLILRWATHRAHWLPRQGAVTGLFMLFYGLFRISLETVREPDVGMPDFPFGLTMGMILSIPMAAIGAYLIWRALKKPVATDLTPRLAAQIRETGPMSMAQFMTACLHDPAAGYYATKPRLGADGDFITAPMVSQMFGEVLGAWMVATWRELGRPARVLLVEVGPGDGSLISDLLRTAQLDPDFLAAAEVRLVETSAPLAVAQRAKLSGAKPAPAWVASLAELPGDAPVLLIANEVLDCLPARQFVRAEAGWAERMVGSGPDGVLCYGLQPAPSVRAAAPEGSVLENSPAQAAFAAEIGRRIAKQGGAALLIDYGRDQPGFGDTLQALQGHRKVEVLPTAGDADLTLHVDFPAVLAAARAEGAAATLLGQGAFLRRLGIEARAQSLTAARPKLAETIARQLDRLIGDDQMGALFKVACLYAPGRPPPGIEPADG